MLAKAKTTLEAMQKFKPGQLVERVGEDRFVAGDKIYQVTTTENYFEIEPVFFKGNKTAVILRG